MLSALCLISISSSLDMQITQTMHLKLDELETGSYDMLHMSMLRDTCFLRSDLATELMQIYLTV